MRPSIPEQNYPLASTLDLALIAVKLISRHGKSIERARRNVDNLFIHAAGINAAAVATSQTLSSIDRTEVEAA